MRSWIGPPWIGLAARIAATCVAAALSATAWAQDYVMTAAATSQYETRPADAVLLPIATNWANRNVSVDLPFAVPYFGTTFQSATVSVYGWVLPRKTTSPAIKFGDSNTGHGQSSTSHAFPYTWSGTGSMSALIFEDLS